jgi:hypothetical protein
VISPPAHLQNTATIEPQNPRQIQQTQVDRGWQNIDPEKARQIKRVFQQGAPPIPKALPPQPAAPPKAVFFNVPTKKPGQPPAAARLPQEPAMPVNKLLRAQFERTKQLAAPKSPVEEQAPPNRPADQAQQLQAEPQHEEQAIQQQHSEAEKVKQTEEKKTKEERAPPPGHSPQ